MEENYIMTDDPAFLAEMAGVVKKLVNRLDAPLIRTILVSYFSTVRRSGRRVASGGLGSDESRRCARSSSDVDAASPPAVRLRCSARSTTPSRRQSCSTWSRASTTRSTRSSSTT